ncbi:MAG: hypothetical protein K5989_01780 [Lachnospiraceae bacterium]|nr:hypothetical protein [Lachnospiraceae bacterium]
MTKRNRKLSAILLAMAMTVTMTPFSAVASEIGNAEILSDDITYLEDTSLSSLNEEIPDDSIQEADEDISSEEAIAETGEEEISSGSGDSGSTEASGSETSGSDTSGSKASDSDTSGSKASDSEADTGKDKAINTGSESDEESSSQESSEAGKSDNQDAGSSQNSNSADSESGSSDSSEGDSSKSGTGTSSEDDDSTDQEGSDSNKDSASENETENSPTQDDSLDFPSDDEGLDYPTEDEAISGNSPITPSGNGVSDNMLDVDYVEDALSDNSVGPVNAEIPVDLDELAMSGGNIDTLFRFPEEYKAQSTKVSLPEYYSSVAEGIVNSPGDQTGTNLCWAYTSASLAETAMMKRFGGYAGDSEYQYSPKQIAKETYNYFRSDWANYTTSGNSSYDASKTDKTYMYLNKTATSGTVGIGPDDERLYQASGSLAWTTFALARWAGPSQDLHTKDEMAYEGLNDAAHLENAYWVPNNDIEAIKTLIQEYGSVGVQILASQNGIYAPLNGYRFSTASPPSTTNHAVTVVGWDDNIPRDKFTNANGKTPSKDGGFLVKNSYGTGRSNEQADDAGETLGGFYWISYADGTFQPYNKAYRIAVAFDFGQADNYTHVYSHDGSNSYDTYQTRRTYTTYTAKSDTTNDVELLKAVGIGVADAGKYKITIYYHKVGKSSSGSNYAINQFPVETFTADVPYTGYHTLELRDPIILYPGDQFTIGVERYDGEPYYCFVDDTNRIGFTYTDESASNNAVSANIFFQAFGTVGDCYFVRPSDGAVQSCMSLGRTYTSGGKTYYYSPISMTARVKAYTQAIDKPDLADQNNLDIALEKYVWSYTGSNINPMAVLKLKDTGYVIMCNRYATSYANHKEAGIGAVIVRGDGTAFSGEISAAFKIVSTPVRIGSCKIYGVENREYLENGAYTQDNIVVRYKIPETCHYLTLTEGVDYTVGSIEGTNAPGKTNTVMITGIGAFRNTVKKKFKIQKANKPKPICDSTITMTLSYQGEVWTDDIHEVEFTNAKYTPEVTLYDTDTGRQLVKGVDYKSVKYKANKNPGLATVTVTAMGGKNATYSGKIVRYFLIKPMRINTDAEISIKKSYTYTGDYLKPKPTVKLYGKNVGSGNLYCVYYNNKGTSAGTSTAQVIIFGKKKYDGYIGYLTFLIKPASSTDDD